MGVGHTFSVAAIFWIDQFRFNIDFNVRFVHETIVVLEVTPFDGFLFYWQHSNRFGCWIRRRWLLFVQGRFPHRHIALDHRFDGMLGHRPWLLQMVDCPRLVCVTIRVIGLATRTMVMVMLLVHVAATWHIVCVSRVQIVVIAVSPRDLLLVLCVTVLIDGLRRAFVALLCFLDSGGSYLQRHQTIMRCWNIAAQGHLVVRI